MRSEEKARRLTRVFYGLLLHKMFQSIAASSVPLFNSRASTRSDALFSANSFVASTSSSRKEGWFGRLLQALHHSRRLQAERTLRQYRHLIDNRWLQFAGQMLEDVTMSVSEKSSERKLRISAPRGSTLLATIAICFVILHILAATMLTSTRQSDAGAAPESPGLSSGD